MLKSHFSLVFKEATYPQIGLDYPLACAATMGVHYSPIANSYTQKQICSYFLDEVASGRVTHEPS